MGIVAIICGFGDGTAPALTECEEETPRKLTILPSETLVMLKTLVVLAALAFGSFATANADPISGQLNIASSTTGFDAFDSVGDILFSGTGTIATSSTGGFSTWGGSSVQLFNTNIFTQSAGSEILGGTTLGGLTFSLDLTALSPDNGYSPEVFVPGGFNITDAGTGVLNVTGYGPTNVSYDLTTQGVPGTEDTFSELVITAAPTPEPASLALFGTGLLGIVGIARRKLKA
jgi:hypothetical protein